MENEIDILKDVVNKFESLNINYMLTGSMAMIFYAKPRMTRDIDLVIELEKIKVQDLVSKFHHTYYISREAVEDSIHRKFIFNIIHIESAIKVDCVIRKENEYRKIEFSRRKKVNFLGSEIYIVSKEDLIISKLFWAKDSHSEQQLNDVKNLIGKDIDKNYIDLWTKNLLINDLWKEILNE